MDQPFFDERSPASKCLFYFITVLTVLYSLVCLCLKIKSLGCNKCRNGIYSKETLAIIIVNNSNSAYLYFNVNNSCSMEKERCRTSKFAYFLFCLKIFLVKWVAVLQLLPLLLFGVAIFISINYLGDECSDWLIFFLSF
jgi:hypothetical protein